MDNNHISTNMNNSISHSVTEIGDRFGYLNLSDRAEQMNNTSRSLPNNCVNNISSRSTSSLNSMAAQTSRLNPSAQEFVPRSNRTNTVPTSTPYRNTNHLSNNTNNNNNINNNFSNGSNNQSSTVHDNENYIEDYVSLSYLKEFINHISNKPSMYEQGINELTLILNSYLDEDGCVLELIVNQIVDQSIVDGNFLYNGVRLCDYFMKHLRKTSSGQSFKQLLFKRNQRECSRKVFDSTSANTFVHLRGLALFTAELYSRCQEPDLAEHLPNLLMNILSSNIQRDENVKCVCDVLKLCGQQLESYFNSKGKPDFKNVLSKLKETSMSTNHIEMVKKMLKLAENNWVQAPTEVVSNIVNPYLNNPGLNYEPDQYGPTYELYDFGNCGDENNEEVCQDFENFLLSQQQQN